MDSKKQSKSNGYASSFSVIKRLLAHMKPYMPLLTLTIIFTLIYITATLATPVVIGLAIDTIIGVSNVDFQQLYFYIILLVSLLIIIFVFQYLANVISSKVSFFTIRDIRLEAFKKLNTVPISYIDTNSHGDIVSRIINDADQVSDGLIQGFTQLFSGIATVAGTIIFMMQLNVTISIVVIVLTPLSLGVAWIIAKRSHKMFFNQAKERGNLGGLCQELIGNQKVVKAFGYEQAGQQRFDVINGELKKYGTGSMFYSSLINPAARFVNGIVYAVVATMGALLVISSGGVFTIGFFSAFLAYANQYTKPFNDITSIITELQTALSASRRVFVLLDAKSESVESDNQVLEDVKGDVVAKNVKFGYTPERELISDFNIKISSGQKVAIVGPTGCGKTTLINLLMRFYDVKSGSIYVDQNSIQTITRSSLRSNYGMVLQESWLFKGTIKDNIKYSNPNATDEQVIDACKKAHIHGFISRLEHGYDTVIATDGGNISQGQKQLLCIARIILATPPMLILDEATSSIDTRTEQQIQLAFNEIMQGRTSFIIAHRLSTIMDADLILVLNNGDIIESGTHSELLEKKGFYHNLYNSQFSIY